MMLPRHFTLLCLLMTVACLSFCTFGDEESAEDFSGKQIQFNPPSGGSEPCTATLSRALDLVSQDQFEEFVEGDYWCECDTRSSVEVRGNIMQCSTAQHFKCVNQTKQSILNKDIPADITPYEPRFLRCNPKIYQPTLPPEPPIS